MKKWMIKQSIVVGLVIGAAGIVGAQQGPELPPDLKAKLEAARAGATPEQKPTSEASGKGEVTSQEAVPRISAEEMPKTFQELVDFWMTPRPYPKATIERIDDRYARAHSAVPWKMEIVREEGDTVWMKGIPPEDPESALHKAWLDEQSKEMVLLAKRDFDDTIGPGEFLDFEEPLVPAATINAMDFVKAGEGLPDGGKWQMGMDLVDFNGDGHLDIVLPPQRLVQQPHPSIYLGDGKGGFTHWTEPRWSLEVPYDYGDIKAADFDGDGHLDIVMAIHFKGQYVIYGSEDLQFRRVRKLPSPDPRVTSRAVTIGDFDGDGRPDVAFEAELDLDMSTNKRVRGNSTVWVVRNAENGWKLDQTEGLPQFVIGDGITAADVDGDGRPDLTVAASANAWRALVFLNRMPEPWVTWGETRIMGNGYHFGVRPLPGGEEGESGVVYAVFQQFFRTHKANERRSGIVRYAPVEGDWSKVEPEVIFFGPGRQDHYYRVAVGDLTGNGLDDLVVGWKNGGLEVWVQPSEGQFFKNVSEAIDVTGRAYDIQLADLNGDAKDDIVAVTAEIEGGTGGVVVFLSGAGS